MTPEGAERPQCSRQYHGGRCLERLYVAEELADGVCRICVAEDRYRTESSACVPQCRDFGCQDPSNPGCDLYPHGR